MPNNTYVALDKVTVTSATPSITFSNISQSYTDLVIVIGNVLVSSNGYSLDFKINGDTGSNYSLTNIMANSAGYRSDRVTNGVNTSNDLCYYYGFSSTVPGQSILNFMNYSSTDLYKTILTKSGATDKETELSTHLWRSNSAITSIEIGANGTTIAAGTTFSLYGILAEAISPVTKAVGGAVYSDSTYYYHVFGASGTFTPLQTITCDYIVVAGGGGGGGTTGGGGGAGGFYSTTAASLSATNYTVTVGAGGAGGTNNGSSGSAGSKGNNSSFNSITRTGGGGGSTSPNVPTYAATTGGSGGGGSRSGSSQPGAAGNQGGYTPVEGYAGGNNYSSGGVYGTGGGGGAGAAGQAGTSTYDGAGGIGATSSLITAIVTATGNGELVSGTGYIAGGGGGASGDNNSLTNYGALGGSGGGGKGGSDTTYAVAGKAGTGSGGGGSGYVGGYLSGTNGGSGVVVIRYAK